MTGLYVHFPFCIRKCLYCDFNSYAGMEPYQRPYVAAVESEIQARAATIYERNGKAEFDTVFFGGGTPTVLPSGMLIETLSQICRHFSVSPNAEVSIEVNPGTVTIESLHELRSGGFNRISFGVQTFDAQLLKEIGRIHGPGDAVDALNSAARAGFENTSLDIMFGLPGQTPSQFSFDLRRALEFRPAHISVYSLIIEEGTPFWTAAEEGSITLPDDETVALMYEKAEKVLDEAGYVHYEISNWARQIPNLAGTSGRGQDALLLSWSSDKLRRSLLGRNVAFCRHNLNYWNAGEYVGIGAGAHSYWGGCRFSNIKRPEDYVSAVEHSRSIIESSEEIDATMAMSEYMILALRTAAGARAEEFMRRFQMKMLDVFGAEINLVLNSGLVEYDGESLRLTARGRILGNEVFVQFV